MKEDIIICKTFEMCLIFYQLLYKTDLEDVGVTINLIYLQISEVYFCIMIECPHHPVMVMGQ